ncbi:MAG TPA: RNA polymerase factor sigma-54 [Xanthomonadales bacterium]|nr:RNA polymerase factor sigma-54 [Xanthomonadales bacterium]
MAEQSLQLRLTQKLALSPQLQQAIRLLQLNRIELREYIQEVLDENPILERDESEGSQDDPEGNEASDTSETDSIDEFDQWDEEVSEYDSWTESEGGFEPSTEMQIPDPDEDSLNEHLLWQINLGRFSETDAAIATAIVFALDEDGFLPDTVEEIRSSLAPELLVSPEEVTAVLHRVQRMEPIGVASRDAGECIRVQLQALPGDTPGRDLALRISRDFLDLVADHETEALRKQTRSSEEALKCALDLVHSLEPRPGARFDNRRDEYLVPDVYVTHNEGEWRVSLSPDNDPGLKLNRYYISLLRKSGGKDAEYLRGRLQEARWLLASLELRNRTLISVAQCIVELQEDFLEHGDLAMRPLILKDVSEAVGVHESTVSRATTRKYMLTPRGIYEMKYFFSSHVHTDHGDPVSAIAVKARLQILLQNEPHEKPLSDQDLSDLLRQTGIRAARRTVAKYRESLGIGSSTERRRQYRRQKSIEASQSLN